MTHQEITEKFYNTMMDKVKSEIVDDGTFAPNVCVLTTSKEEGRFDINMMHVPSFVEMADNGSMEDIIKAKQIVEFFVKMLEVKEGKIKIALFHSEIYFDGEDEFLYTFQKDESGHKVFRYKINREMNVDKVGNFIHDVELDVLDIV